MTAVATLDTPQTEAPALETRRGPGRPRDEDIDERLLEATLALIDESVEPTAARITDRSGVSKAALYRRWPSLTTLIAAALDVGREIPPEIPEDSDLREVFLNDILGVTSLSAAVPFVEARFRQRIRLAMADQRLQKTYWSSHVAQRRVPMENALRRGIERGTLRADLDPAACFDLIAGVVYYQLVVRGDSLTADETRERCRLAIDVAWRGMLA